MWLSEVRRRRLSAVTRKYLMKRPRFQPNDGWKASGSARRADRLAADAAPPRPCVFRRHPHPRYEYHHIHPASREELGVHQAHARRPGEPRRRRRRRWRRRLEGVEKKRRRRRAGVRVEFAGRPARSPRRARRRALRRARALRRGRWERVRGPYLLQRRQRQAHLLGEEVAAGAPRAVSGGGPLGAAVRDRARGGRGDVLEVFCGTPHRARFECRLLCDASARRDAGKRPAGVRSGPSPEFRTAAGSARGALARTERVGGAPRVSVVARPDALGFFVFRSLARAGSRPRGPRAGPRPRAGLGVGAADVRVGGRGRSPRSPRRRRAPRAASGARVKTCSDGVTDF